jgi:hypothetical protein
MYGEERQETSVVQSQYLKHTLNTCDGSDSIVLNTQLHIDALYQTKPVDVPMSTLFVFKLLKFIIDKLNTTTRGQ